MSASSRIPPTMTALSDIVDYHVSARPDATAFIRRTRKGWVAVSMKEFHQQVLSVADSLARNGIDVGDRVAVLSRTRYEWTVVDAALWYLGAVSVPLSELSHAEYLARVFRDAMPKMAIVDSAALVTVLHHLRAEGVAVEQIWTMDPMEGFSSVVDAMNRAPYGAQQDLWQRRRRWDADHLATIGYSLNSLARPKGVMLTHANLLAGASNTADALQDITAETSNTVLVYQQMIHAPTRLMTIMALLSGLPVAHSDPARIARDLEVLEPAVLVTTPHLLIRIHAAAAERAQAAGKGRLYQAAQQVVVDYSKSLSANENPQWSQVRAALEGPALSRVRATLGNNLQWVLCFGTGLPAEVGHFYRGLGTRVLVGYGPTEASGAATVHRPRSENFDSSGQAINGIEVAINDAGQVHVRGPQVFVGYWQPKAESLDIAQVWRRLPDRGAIERNRLVLTFDDLDRVTTTAGVSINPTVLEEFIKGFPFVAHAIVVGQGHASLGVLIALDVDAVAAWLHLRGRADLPLHVMAMDPEVQGEVRSAVDMANERVGVAERIRHVAILSTPLSQEAGHLNEHHKIVRAAVLRDFSREIDAMYGTRIGG